MVRRCAQAARQIAFRQCHPVYTLHKIAVLLAKKFMDVEVEVLTLKILGGSLMPSSKSGEARV